MKCTVCGESYGKDEIKEWKTEKEPYFDDPFICPDCYDSMQRVDPEDLMKECLDAI